MSQPQKTNSFESVFDKKDNTKNQDMLHVKDDLIAKFKKANENKVNDLIEPKTNIDIDVEIVDFVNKNKENFQEALEVAETPEQIEETIKAFNPLNDFKLKEKTYTRWANRPDYPYYGSLGSYFSYHILSFLLGKPKNFGAPNFIYYLAKDRINMAPEHFRNPGHIIESEHIQTTHKISELMAWGTNPVISKVDANSPILSKIKYSLLSLKPRGTNKLAVFLIAVGISLAFVFSGGTALNKKFKEYQAKSQMQEQLVKDAKTQLEYIKKQEDKAASDFQKSVINEQQLNQILEQLKNEKDAQQKIIDGK